MRTRRSQGFTLVELLIAVAIIAILSATGYSMLSYMIPRYRTYGAARDLGSTIQKIRGLAAQDGVEYRIALVLYDEDYKTAGTPGLGTYYVQAGNRDFGSTSWEHVPLDAREDLSDDDVSEGTVDLAQLMAGVSIAPWTALSGPLYQGASNADCIVISPRGWLVNPNGDFGSDGYITIEFVNKKALERGAEETYEVRVARSGMVRLDFNDSLWQDVDNPLGIDQRSKTSTTTGGGGYAE